MPERRGRRWSVRQWLLALLVGAGAIALAWAVVMTSAARAVPQPIAQRLGLDVGSPAQLYRSAAQEMISQRGQIRPETHEAIAQTLNREPLAPEPFAFAALRKLGTADIGGAERLLAEARRRDPRDRLSRLLLMSVYIQSGRVAEGVQEIRALLRIMPRGREVLVPEMAKLAADPRSRASLLAAIGADPLMSAVLDHLAASGAQTDLILQLAARQPPSAAAFRPWQTNVLQRLVDQGQVRRAYELWLRFLGRSGGPAGTIYDARFQGLPGSAPFNWSLLSSDVGSAEPASGEALEVTYFGRAPGALARQLLLLRPGSYTFEVQAEGEADGKGSKLVWRLACRGSQANLFALPLEQVTYTPKRLTARFTVPGGCEAQSLELSGVPAEFPATQTVRLTGLNIAPAGAAR